MTNLNELRARQDALETANETLHEVFRKVDGDAHEASTLARANVKLMTALRETQLAHGEVIAGLVTEVAAIKIDLGAVKDDLGAVKVDLGGVKADLGGVGAEVAGVKVEVAELKADVNGRLGTIESEIKDGLAEVLRRLPA